MSEEPLFRGFAWGYLRRVGVPVVSAWLLVALSFVVAHASYLRGHLISLLILVPVGFLTLGFIAWKSRTIASSMGMHGMVNALGYHSGHIVASLRA